MSGADETIDLGHPENYNVIIDPVGVLPNSQFIAVPPIRTSFQEPTTSFLSNARDSITKFSNGDTNYKLSYLAQYIGLPGLAFVVFYIFSYFIILAFYREANSLVYFTVLISIISIVGVLAFIWSAFGSPSLPTILGTIGDFFQANKIYIGNMRVLIIYGIYTLFISILYTSIPSLTKEQKEAEDNKTQAEKDATPPRATSPQSRILNQYNYIITPFLFGVTAILAIWSVRHLKINEASYLKLYYALVYLFTTICICCFYFYDSKSTDSYMSTTLGVAFKINLVMSIVFLIYTALLYAIPLLIPAYTYDKQPPISKVFKWIAVSFGLFFIFMMVAIYLAYHKDRNSTVNPMQPQNQEKEMTAQPGEKDPKDTQGRDLVILMVVGSTIIMFVFFVIYLTRSKTEPIVYKTSNFLESRIYYGINAIFMLVVFIVFCVWIINSIIAIQTKRLGVFQFIINSCVLLFFGWIVYKYYFNNTENSKRPTFVNFFIYLVYFIPCLLADLYAFVKTSLDPRHISLLIFLITILILLTNISRVKQAVVNQNGLLLIESPLPLYDPHIITAFQDWPYRSPYVGPDTFNYNYALSFWVRIEAFDKNLSSPQCKSIINYFNFPNICFTHLTPPTSKDDEGNPILTPPHLTFEFANNEKTIMIPIDTQKWNHLVINYSNNVMDVFCNNYLVNTITIVAPNQLNRGMFTTGSENGIEGSICNVNFYENALSLYQISYLYNLVYLFNPPLILDMGTSLQNLIKPSNDRFIKK
jgi:hypothetical protein